MAEIKKKTENGARIEVTDGALIPVKSNSGLLNAWRITFALAVLTLIFLPIIKPDPYWSILKVLSRGIPVTFEVTAMAIVGAIILGLLAGLGQISRVRILNRIAGVYIELIRGIPLLVQLIFIYFALGKLFRLEGIIAAVIALSICYGAYMGEIFRAGIQSIPKGQMEAAIALGLTRGQALRYVILPQTMKLVLPAIGNEFIAMLKDSSLVSILAITDILRHGRQYVSRTFLSLQTYAMVALVYLVITLLLSRLVAVLEERMKKDES